MQADLSKPESIPATLVGIHTVIDCATGRPEEPIKTASIYLEDVFHLMLFGFIYILYLICNDGIHLLLTHIFNLGRLGRKSCPNTMCKGNGNTEVCVLLHPQL